MLQVIPLLYGTIFKKVFGDLEVFNHFASDVLDMTIEVDAVHQEYRYPSPVGKVNVEYDLRHRLVFLNPKVINERTPKRARPWLQLSADSLDGEVDEARYPDPTMQRALRTAVTRTVSPDDLARIKDEAAWEATKTDARAEGKADGLRIAITALCDVLGVTLDEARARWLVEADVAALEGRLAGLCATRRWEL